MQTQQLLESISFDAVPWNGLHSDSLLCNILYMAISVYKLFLNHSMCRFQERFFVVNKSGVDFFFFFVRCTLSSFLW